MLHCMLRKTCLPFTTTTVKLAIMQLHYSALALFAIILGLIQPSSTIWCGHPNIPLCTYYSDDTNPELNFGVVPYESISVNGSTTTWGAHKALGFNTWAMQSEPPSPNMRIRFVFKNQPPIERGWGIPLLERYLNQSGMIGTYPPIQPQALEDFIFSFELGQQNGVRDQPWDGQHAAPRQGEAARLRTGGSELVVQTGQIVDMPAGGKIRIEMDATLEAWGEGTVVQCINTCTNKSVQWTQTMKDGDMNYFYIGPETEFLEIKFSNAMRIIVQTDRDYVLYPPRDATLVAEMRHFLPNEKINTEAWKKLPLPPMQEGVKSCEKRREYEGQLSERDDSYCQSPTILRFRNWQLMGDGPIPEALPPRPLTTVSDFVIEFFKYQRHWMGR